jgi:serine/threonine protein kinase
VPQKFPVQTIVPSYVVDKLIGTGSSSTVHRAHDVNSGMHVALKQFTRSADDEEVLQFIREEFDILRKFHHSNIVKPIRLEEDYADASKVRVVMILEYGGSMTLTQYVQRNKTLAEDQCRGLSLQLCSAIFYLHCKKYVHRDVKPDNIVLSSPLHNDPDTIPVTKGSPAVLYLKMIDFNTATCFGIGSSMQMPIWLSPPVTTQEMADLVQSMTHKRKLRVDYSMLLTPTGTGLYQAGEVVTGHDYTEKVDIWSAGMTVLYMICGADVARPQGRIRSHIRTYGKLMRTLSPDCMDFLDEMLQPNPVARASALQCYTHRWFTCDIPRSKRRGRLANYRGSAVSGAMPSETLDKSTASAGRSRRSSSNLHAERSQSAPPCPTARLQLMWFESLALRQTYVVKMKRGKATHQELIVSLSQNIVAYPGTGGSSVGALDDEKGREIENALQPLLPGEVATTAAPTKGTTWRAPIASDSRELLAEKELPTEQPSSTCSCCRRRSARVSIESSPLADVVIDVAANGKGIEIVPTPKEHQPGSGPSERSEPPRFVTDRKSSFQMNDDKISRISDAESGKTKNSRASRNTHLTADSKLKHIQTCSWMFRDETDGFAIRLPDGVNSEAPITLNLSDMASAKGGPFAGDDQNEAVVPVSMNVISSKLNPGYPSRDLGTGRSEASVSLAGGSGTTGSRTALSQAATTLISSRNLKDLFNMIWSARGFRRKYSRECPF